MGLGLANETKKAVNVKELAIISSNYSMKLLEQRTKSLQTTVKIKRVPYSNAHNKLKHYV